MIGAEEIKALMANKKIVMGYDESANEDRFCLQIAEKNADGLLEIKVVLYDEPARFMHNYITTLQTLLNQAAEVVSKYEDHFSNLAFFEAKYTCHKCNQDSPQSNISIAFNAMVIDDMGKALAAIEPYLTKEVE